MTIVGSYAWRVTGKSVRGPAHETNGLPNQDAIGWWPADDGDPPTVLAVSDGHSDPKCFRSDAGSRFGVEAAIAAMRRVAGGAPAERGALAADIVTTWRHAVLQDLAAHPIDAAAIALLDAKAGPAGRALVEQDPVLAYGATLLAVLATASSLVFAQIGDGDLLITASDGTTTRVFPHDMRFLANETTSLCLPNAADEVRVRTLDLAREAPELVIACTDGYVNSFLSDADFLQIGRDYQQQIGEDGLDALGARLGDYLADTTGSGSGDDITIGIMTRVPSSPSAAT
ncbi:MAG: PP2C family serine/threonine-protein phosphatase [Candidatus Elarobacter sp.]